MNYNWIKADTPEARERLEKMLKSYEVVFARIDGETAVETNAMLFINGKGNDKVEIQQFGNQHDVVPLEDIFDMGIDFLDPSPNLELPELQWELQNKTFETAKNGEWEYRAGKGGWSVWYNGNRMAFEVCDGIETAKAAAHEWRVNHLKSMIA